MQAKRYWEEKRKDLENQLQALTQRAAESNFSAKEWTSFEKKARRQLDKAYADVCDRVVNRLRFSGRLGWNPLGRGLKDVRGSLYKNGTLRLISYIRQSHDGRSEVLTYPVTPAQDPARGKQWQYSYINIRPDARHYGATYLSLDLNDRVGHSICYRDGVESVLKVKCARDKDNLNEDITDVIEKVLHEASEGMVDLHNRFEAIAFGQIQHDKLQNQIKAVRTKIQVADRCMDLWGRVHLPEKVLIEIFQSMEAFSGRTAKVGSVLLKGVPGTGKTFLAANIAQSVGAKFIKAGVDRLKQGYIGQSAQAVQSLWKEARENKPCVIFLDECDSLFAKRGAPEADKFVAEITNAFLTQWDGKEPGVWIIGATNRPDLLDGAILSRFGSQIEIPLPDAEARLAILTQELHEAGYQGAIPSDVASLTQGMSGRDLSQIAQKAGTQHSAANLKALIAEMRSASNHTVDTDATWNSLILDATTMEKLKTTCGMLQDVEAWRVRGVQVANGILLEGPPGTGKTQIGRTLANESHLAFVKATTADLRGIHLGESANKVKNLFERARSMSPSILFIDELDICAPARGGSSNDTFSQEIIGQMLQEMSGIESSSCHVFVLAATNHRDLIDPAVLRRFTETLYIPLPDMDGRTRLLRVMVAAAKVNFSMDEIYTLAGISEGMSGSDLKNWVAKAQQRAVARAMKQGGASKYDLTMEDFVETANATRQTTTK